MHRAGRGTDGMSTFINNPYDGEDFYSGAGVWQRILKAVWIF